MPRRAPARRAPVRRAPARRAPARRAPARRVYSRFVRNYRKPYRYPGVGRTLGSLAGGALGSYFGNPALGAAVGGGIGHLGHAAIKTITGYGDYTVKQNSVVYNRDSVPEFTTRNPRCTILSHSEFIKDVRGSTTFAVDSFDINATNGALFPWLSQIARNYEQVVWQGLVFQFKTTCATAVASTNTALGTVVMATQYDTLSSLFTNKQQMENYEFSQSSVPSSSLMHPIECDPKLTANQGLFYNDNPNNSNINADPRLYNIGRFNIATVGMQAAATIGELWVTYKVCLLKPKLNSQNNWSDHWVLDSAGLTASNPYGNAPVLSSTSSSYQAFESHGSHYSTPSDQQFTNVKHNPWPTGFASADADCYINPSFTGDLLVVYQLHGGNIPKEDPVLTLFGPCIQVSTAALNQGFVTYQKQYANPNVLNADNVMFCFVIRIQGGYLPAGNNAGFKLASGTPGAPTEGNLSIYAVNGNIRN